jgi:DNA-binding NarL/FixJ family response regulator
MSRISVFLSDWQVLFREGIHFTLSGEEDMDVTGEATSSDEALKAIQTNPPRVAILNAHHEDFAGIRVTRYLRQNYPSVAVLLIIDNQNEEHLFQTMKSGASACITKETDPADLINTIRVIAQRGKPIAEAILIPGIAVRVLGEFEQFNAMSEMVGNLLASLTQSEMEILRRMAQEGSIEQVSRALNMSRENISENLERILAKLVTNDHIRQVMAAAQDGRMANVFRARTAGQPAEEYITRDEFAAFRDSIWEHFRAAVDDIK